MTSSNCLGSKLADVVVSQSMSNGIGSTNNAGTRNGASHMDAVKTAISVNGRGVAAGPRGASIATGAGNNAQHCSLLETSHYAPPGLLQTLLAPCSARRSLAPNGFWG